MIAARKTAAFLDVDGTLLPAPSLEWRFVSWLVACEALSSWQVLGWAAATGSAVLSGEFRALRTNKSYLSGLPERFIHAWEASLSTGALAAFSQGAERIVWHLEQGHRVFLVSGTLAPLAQILARRLGGSIEIRATNLEVIDGAWSGRLEGNHMSGPEKARTVAQIASRSGLSLADSYAYGNHLDDLPLLESVGNPVAVNPGLRLKRIAARRCWRIARWQSSQSDAAASQALLSPQEAR